MIRKAPHGAAQLSEWRLVQSPELQEACRRLLRSWKCSDRGVAARSLGFTSFGHGEGVTTIAAHVAATAASQSSQRVLLVDFHLHAPQLHKIFSVPQAPGLAEALSNEGEEEPSFQSLPLENLSLLSAGDVTRNVEQLFEAEHLEQLVRELSARFDLVIFDLPPFGKSSAGTRLCTLIDGVVLVVEAERTTWSDAAHAKRQLELASARLLGVVVNNKR